MLDMKANKNMVHCQETGNVILLKDWSNVALTARKVKSRNDLDVTVQVLTEKYGMLSSVGRYYILPFAIIASDTCCDNCNYCQTL